MSDNLLRRFRGDLRAPLPLHPLETALIWVAALNVCSLPWMLGGMRIWAQLITLGLAILAFGISVVPRNYTGQMTSGQDFTLYPWRKLIRWPLFWIGAVFFAYVLIQALNPAYLYVAGESSWSMIRIDHIEWLPTGLTSPFEQMNTWRQMIIWGAPFLLACALWVGFTRRKSVIWLVGIIAANTVVLGALALAQRATQAKQILWSIDSSNEFWGPFIYRNHGASYMVIGFMLLVAFAAWMHRRTRERQHRSGSALVLAFLALFVAVTVLASASRGAVIALTVGLLVIVLWGGGQLIVHRSSRSQVAVVAIVTVLLSGFAILSLQAFNAHHTYERFERLWDSADANWESRQIATAAATDMWGERPWTGWGAGGFRFLFPRYQTSYPEITWDRPGPRRRFMFWEYAHNDWIQLPTEVGLVGTGLILLMAGSGGLLVIRRRGQLHPFTLIAVGGCLTTWVHARGEFLFYNPAILNLWTVTAVLALCACQIEFVAHCRTNDQ